MKNVKLRNIRYNLRTILRLAFDEQINFFNEKIFAVQNLEKLDFAERQVKHRDLLRRKDALILQKQQYPINCSICGDRMEDLIFNPSISSWRCILCNEDD